MMKKVEVTMTEVQWEDVLRRTKLNPETYGGGVEHNISYIVRKGADVLIRFWSGDLCNVLNVINCCAGEMNMVPRIRGKVFFKGGVDRKSAMKKVVEDDKGVCDYVDGYILNDILEYVDVQTHAMCLFCDNCEEGAVFEDVHKIDIDVKFVLKS